MRFDYETDELVLSTGKRIEAYGAGHGALSPMDDGSLSYGSDGGVSASTLTPEERSEIAADMIARWRAWETR